jgi:hypothetical protein
VRSNEELRLAVGKTADGVSFPDLLKKTFPHDDSDSLG